MDPRDYVWSAPSPAQQQSALQQMWHQLGAMAMLQSHGCGWPAVGPPGPPMLRGIGAVPLPTLLPSLLPDFRWQGHHGPWHPLQHVSSVDGQIAPQQTCGSTPQGGLDQAPASNVDLASTVSTNGSPAVQHEQKGCHHQKREALPTGESDPAPKCTEDFLECMLDINEEELQQLLQEPLDTLGVDNTKSVAMDTTNGSARQENNGTSSCGLRKSPSYGSEHSETLPDDSMLLFDNIDLSCLKEVNSFPDLADLERLGMGNTGGEGGSARLEQGPSPKKKRNKGGVMKKKGRKTKMSLPLFVDDECLKELERMLGTGACAGAVGCKSGENASAAAAEMSKEFARSEISRV